MLKVNSIKSIGFIGEANSLVTQLTCPYCVSNRCCFYYKTNVYKIVSPTVSKIKVVVFPATDMLWRLEDLLTLSSLDNTIIYITDYYMLRKMGVKINKQALRYILSCPVVFATRHSTRGLNRLLSAIHLVSNCPSTQNANIIKKSIFKFVSTFI